MKKLLKEYSFAEISNIGDYPSVTFNKKAMRKMIKENPAAYYRTIYNTINMAFNQEGGVHFRYNPNPNSNGNSSHIWITPEGKHKCYLDEFNESSGNQISGDIKGVPPFHVYMALEVHNPTPQAISIAKGE